MLTLLLLVGCAEESAAPKAPAEPCDLSFSVSVADGAEDVPGNAPVRVTLSAPDPSAMLSGSVPGSTTRNEDGTVLTWAPQAPIDPLTDVDLEIRTCAGSSTTGYRTSALGAPLEAGVDLSQTGFRVDLASGRILRPTTGSALLGALAAQGTEILLGLSPNGGGMDYRLAVTADGAQDPCSRTLDLQGGTLDRGWFAFGPGRATFYVGTTEVVLEQLAFGGAVRADGSGLGAAWLRGFVGVEALAVAYAGGDVEQACAFFGGLGAPCEPCPESGGQCLAVEVEGLDAEGTGEAVLPVQEACQQ
jgi:hypothetical protein